ncbi:hypothetical protein K443DRAFT_681087 [Laccaria amethystina LaAM-08-1]|uniref:Cyclase n=1 Tax=Laccaria amethystina LaAM-08-1 TaxID=1095629 RepID=A0A0C9X9H9_9AGAR|nr:hypothetical protein K443DRAFT_681087 [Laccaria amethystina LaAM-08-1]
MTATKRLKAIMVHLASGIKTSTPSSAFDSATEEHAQAATDRDIVRKDIMALPTFDELPKYKNFTGCAWGVWGRNDQLGTVNLLTDEVVQRAATEEIKTGRSVSLNWPINFPEKPMFGRKTPEVCAFAHLGADLPVRDDEIHINTQSGTQWDGMRHFGVLEHKVYYQGVSASDVPAGPLHLPDPNAIDLVNANLGIQNWATHGICGRGVLLDLVRYYTKGGKPLPYDPWTTHGISVAELKAVAEAQGVKFRAGDIMLLRVGFIQKYHQVTGEERDALQGRPETFAGIEQSEDMKKFLWNNHFAAVASDQPALESWPAEMNTYLHQTILGLWGMPLGEFFDLEKLSEVCAETGRYTFFFSSWPMHIIGGCASPPNAAAMF